MANKVNIKDLKLHNDKLEEAVAAMAKDNNKENLANLMKSIKDAQLLVPVDFPPNMTQEDKVKFAKGTLKKLPNMVPVILKNDKDERFAPVYTSAEQIKGGKPYRAILTVPFKEVLRVAGQQSINVKGVILNPETNNLILHPQFLEAMRQIDNPVPPQKREIKMTKDQFDVFSRKQVEAMIMPKLVYEQKGAFLEGLEDKGSAYIYDIYKKPYGTNVVFPFTEEDFDVMILSIDEDTTVASIELPSKKMAPGIARAAYVVWNSTKEEMHYYLIEKGQPEQSDVICGIYSNGKREELMTAPATGSELYAVLDLVNEEE